MVSLSSDLESGQGEQAACLIAPMSTCRQHLKTVARWFHSERQLAGFAGSLSDCEAKLACQLDSPNLPFTAIAHIDGRAVGAASLVYYRFTENASPQIPWLTNVYVHPRYRGRGLGDRLVAYMEAFARQKDIVKVNLYTRDKRQFYQRRAWEFNYKARVSGRLVDVMSLNLGVSD